MNRDELQKILDSHARWLNDDGGERADLRYTDLSYADLRHCNLRYADLRHCNLHKADLRGADLRYTDLLGAYLLEAKHFYLLPVQDPRGYSWPHAVQCDDGLWRIRAGCRFFTIAEARDHWGPSYLGGRRIGDMYLAAVDWLERVIAEDSEQEAAA